MMMLLVVSILEDHGVMFHSRSVLHSSQCSTERLLRIYRERTMTPLVLAIQHQNVRAVDALLVQYRP
jgi:hypothetical protein